MLALKERLAPQQVQGETPEVLTRVLDDGVNLAVWKRCVPVHIVGFADLLLAQGASLAESLVLEINPNGNTSSLHRLARGYTDLEGHDGFIADATWLVEAYAALLGARRVGLRLRALDKAMCPRFHVDHVPVRLITSYAGVGSQWLEEGAMQRKDLGCADHEPENPALIQQMGAGDVGLLKGEKWFGNEGAGLIHRSPPLEGGHRRLILTLDWLA